MTEPEVDLAHVWHATLLGLEDSGTPARDRAFLRIARLVGIVGEADLVRGRIPAQDGGRATAGSAGRVGDVMTRSPITREPGSDVADVVATMLDHQLRALPIVEGGELVGMLARRDVLRCVAKGELTSAEVWRDRFGLVDHDRG